MDLYPSEEINLTFAMSLRKSVPNAARLAAKALVNSYCGAPYLTNAGDIPLHEPEVDFSIIEPEV